MSNNNTKKALVENINFGNVTFEGVMLPDGEYGIAVSQIWEMFNGDKGIPEKTNLTSQNLKRLLGRDFQKSQRVKIPDLQTGKDRNSRLVISLEDFEIVLAKLDRAGNKKAQDFRDDMVGLSLRQIFADAFGEKFEKEEREKWIKQRSSHRVGYKPRFTDFLKHDNPDRKDYGKQMNIFKSKIGLRRDSVNEYDLDELDHLNRYEFAYQVLRNSGFDHHGAVQELSSLHLQEIRKSGEQKGIDLNF